MKFRLREIPLSALAPTGRASFPCTTELPGRPASTDREQHEGVPRQRDGRSGIVGASNGSHDRPAALRQKCANGHVRSRVAAISGLLLLITAYLFAAGFLTPVTQTIAWFSIFFFASAASSSAYLTASEIFPLETRALAIACFYALGTAIGGGTSPLLFGWLIQSGSAWLVSAGYLLAAALLLIAALTDLMLGLMRKEVPRKHRGSVIKLMPLRLDAVRTASTVIPVPGIWEIVHLINPEQIVGAQPPLRSEGCERC